MIAIYLNEASAGEYDTINEWLKTHGLEVQTFNVQQNTDAASTAAKFGLTTFPVFFNEVFDNHGNSSIVKYAEGANVIATLGADVASTVKTALEVTFEAPVQTTGPLKS